jgi:hypothetical protein
MLIARHMGCMGVLKKVEKRGEGSGIMGKKERWRK